MVLRYFYIEEYNGVAQGLDINLGGQYKFYYIVNENCLQIIKDEKYVDNLYQEYNVISDISAILGKNSAGKTTVLRMINSVFNGFYISNDKKYIILFENEENYILYTNYERLKCNDGILKKKLKCVMQKYFNPIEELKNVGLIYFSNIFDKATPFKGNANLIDISTNYTFENFYMEKVKKESNRSDEKSSIMDEYKSSCILQEIDFLLDMERENAKDEIKLLFEIPNQIELGFAQKVTDNGNGPFCENDEYNALLLGIYKPMDAFFCEEQGENIVMFRNEIIFYLVFDQLCQLCKEERYNMLDALKYWRDKIEHRDWNLFDYYQNILDKLESEYVIDEIIDNTLIESIEAQEIDYEDIIDDFEQIQDELNELQEVDFNLILKKILRIESFVVVRAWDTRNAICHYLKEAVAMLEEIHEDLLECDYDLFNISYIYEVIGLIEKAYSYFVKDFDKEEMVIYDDDTDMEKIGVYMDADTERRIELLKKGISMLNDFINRYDYNVNSGMLNVKLDNQDILEFIYIFRELKCETVELDVKRNDISSGHSAYLDMCARINAARKSGEIQKKKNVILLIDEGDIYLHPEKQLAYMNNLLKLLQILYKYKKVQVIVTSNSPFIISDIQDSNILYLEKKHDKICVARSAISNTFASNVNSLLLDSFFIEKGLIGEFAYEKIDGILQEINGGNIIEERYEYIKNILGIIGEPIIRRKLEHMLISRMKSYDLQREIQYYEEKIEKLRSLSGGKNND